MMVLNEKIDHYRAFSAPLYIDELGQLAFDAFLPMSFALVPKGDHHAPVFYKVKTEEILNTLASSFEQL